MTDPHRKLSIPELWRAGPARRRFEPWHWLTGYAVIAVLGLVLFAMAAWDRVRGK